MSVAYKTALALLKDSYHIATLQGSRSEQVYSFHEFYKQPLGPEEITPTLDHMSDERIALRLGLILEKVRELFDDGFDITLEFKFITENDDNKVNDDLLSALDHSKYRNMIGAVDALGNISYVVDGFAIEMGANLDDVVNEIHASNMTKPDTNGNPIYRDDGKVLKGPHYVKPDLSFILDN